MYHLEGGDQTNYLDANGNVIREEDESGRVIWEYTYDSDGRQIKRVWHGSDGFVVTTTSAYDANGNIVKEVETDNEGGEGTTTYQYKLDANGNATQITRRTENRNGDFTYSYTTVTDYRYVDSFDLGRIWIDYYYPETF